MIHSSAPVFNATMNHSPTLRDILTTKEMKGAFSQLKLYLCSYIECVTDCIVLKFKYREDYALM